jgi:hypothetical protein
MFECLFHQPRINRFASKGVVASFFYWNPRLPLFWLIETCVFRLKTMKYVLCILFVCSTASVDL